MKTRPKTLTTWIPVRMSPKTVNRLEKLAAGKGRYRGRSFYLRAAVEAGLPLVEAAEREKTKAGKGPGVGP